MYAALKESPDKLTALVAVCKGLLNELVPLKPFAKICETFTSYYRNGQSLLPIVEAVRMLPEIREKLPGQHEYNNRFSVGTELKKTD